MQPLSILTISGSLRAGSFNSALLDAAQELAPAAFRFDRAQIGRLPLYSEDLDVDGGPSAVQEFKAQIDAADGLLIATPEYNYGVPGGLKNAIDWASRPAYRSVLAGKPVAILGASMSAVGSARAQGQLKQVLLGTVSEVFPYPEVLVAGVQHRFADGRLDDEDTEAVLTRMLESFADWLVVRRPAAEERER